MGVQQFNERYLANSKVPGGGETGGSTPPSRGGSAVGMPSGVKKADGTANLGTTTVTKQAGPRSVPSGKDSRPAGVDTFNDDGV